MKLCRLSDQIQSDFKIGWYRKTTLIPIIGTRVYFYIEEVWRAILLHKIGLNEIRTKFLEFFKSKDHLVKPSYSLVPENDKSLLLINSGMAPLKSYYMGIEAPPSKRIATCQKCVRTGDIDNVGKTARHATFFEMLGNFSFGDYFKKESIEWGWEFITQYLKLPIDKLWVTIYEKDDESYTIWNQIIGLPAERIVKLGKEDNFWEIGVGPCGPCSELYFDRGEKYGCENPDCKPGCDCDRYVEFWNHVFTQFNRDESGNYTPLPKPNIDTGMGLERIACIMQEVDSIFEVDTIRYILNIVTSMARKTYGNDKKSDLSIRIITDHIRAIVFMINDGILPNNEGRGYVLRRLIRRAARHGKLIGIEKNFLTELSNAVIEMSKSAYPEILEKKDYIQKIISVEEERFQETIEQGNEILKDYMQHLKQANQSILSGKKAFKLYDTFGFPLELTKEILEEENMTIDEEEFKIEMEKQRKRARTARNNDDEQGWKEETYSKLSKNITSKFEGYKQYELSSQILTLIKNSQVVKNAKQGDDIIVILDSTPFYPEGGGQAGDKGILLNEFCKIKIWDCKKVDKKILHFGKIIEGTAFENMTIKAAIDINNRLDTARNHTATHLLHKALKETLGSHVEQSGSLVTSDRLRFDFSHFQSLTTEEIEKIEETVNQKILDNLNIVAQEMPLSEAKKHGAIALFGEKYGEIVRVVSMGKYSTELCGGTHLYYTSQIGLFKIISESGIAAGIRRIEAVTGMKAYKYVSDKETYLNKVSEILKVQPKEAIVKAENLMHELKKLEKEIESLKAKLAGSAIDEILNNIQEINGIKIVSHKLSGLDMNNLRTLGDQLKNKLGSSGLVVLGAQIDEKVQFVAMATDDVVAKGIHAGNIIKQIAKITGGGGGGRPQMAQAGGKDPTKIDEALGYVKELVKKQIQ